jgi:type II secretory pathway pseudopilin PulG
MIELLVVLGIILILVGLFFAGAKVVTGQAKERDTKNMLEACKSMFENYRQATKLSRYPTGISFGPAGTVTTNTTWYTAQEPAIGAASSDALGLMNDAGMPASPSQILSDSVLIYSAIESLPQNQTIITNLPANKKINIRLTATSNVAIPLDGWGNPILFVPGGGLGTNSPLALVWIDGTTNAGIVTSTQIITPLTNPTPATYNPTGTVSSNQPFFVSAGPDGDLSNAHGWTSTSGAPVNSTMTDDNLYSFQ